MTIKLRIRHCRCCRQADFFLKKICSAYVFFVRKDRILSVHMCYTM
ncbi:hypothetical protein HMPREF3033_01564 [Veillonellaceae bacterium DNF00751]|uniref:Uncharacterized protein n=1 Tax=Megasphaera lornae TaxID=1000568 RepID=D3LX54_9FIRM|nr:hypothetical protein HMPREF0889_0110 [Megasphaera genomosp. type_1 str. 28L]KXB90060.1 hypothetical protein HMPREF3033_01564 [Veillonellaceae bacterium DNF00751]